MNRAIFFLFICSIAFIGCKETEQRSEPTKIEGIKISDIEPFDKPEMPAERHFRIYTFILSEEMLASSDNIFAMLSKNELTFVSEQAFKANDFAVGYAKADLWAELGNRLKQAGAVGIKETAMIVYDDKGEDLTFGMLNKRVSIDYFTSHEESFKTNISPGQLAWRILAIPIEAKPRTASVSIAAVSKPDIPAGIDPFLQSRKPKAVIFNVSEFELEMKPGDFLVLGPEKYDPKLSLETLNLTASGQFELLDIDPNDIVDVPTGKLTLGRLLFKIEKKPLVRFFVVVCLGTGN